MEVFAAMTPWGIGGFTQFELLNAWRYAHPEDE